MINASRSILISSPTVQLMVKCINFVILSSIDTVATILNSIAEDWQIQDNGNVGKSIETELLNEVRICLDHDKKVRSFGRETPFRRTNKVSEEVARKYMIMKTLQMKEEKNAGPRDADTLQDMCQNLTSEFLENNSACLSATCDSISPFRSIDGCCNNLESPRKGTDKGLYRISQVHII